jgi:hypothetical protein
MALSKNVKLALAVPAIGAIAVVIAAILALTGTISVPFITDWLAHRHPQEPGKNATTMATTTNGGQAQANTGNDSQSVQNTGSNVTINQYNESKTGTDLTGNQIFDLKGKAVKNPAGDTYVSGTMTIKYAPRAGEEWFSVCLVDDSNPCHQVWSGQPNVGTESYNYSIAELPYTTATPAHLVVRACLADQGRVLAYFKLEAQKQSEALPPKCTSITLDRPK